MSFKARLATLAEAVAKSRRFELWVQTEDRQSYQPLRGGGVLTPGQLNERKNLPGVQVMALGWAPAGNDK